VLIMNLLIVDNEPSSRHLLRVQLEAQGHSVTEAANGQDALGIVRKGSVDGVISDILMPELDGFRLCYELRRGPIASRRIPFVLYTACFVSAADRQLAQTLGADGFICKPALPTVILAAILDARNRPARDYSAPSMIPDNAYLLERYNGALVRKLQERNGELERSVAQVHQAHEEILGLNFALETRIMQATAALDAANVEIEIISQALARHLHKPLQMICMSARRLEQPLGFETDDEYRDCVAQIIGATRRMNQLVDVFTERARIGGTQVNRVPLDLDALVDEAIETASADARERGIHWQRHRLPPVSADPALLRHVLATLIGNAVRSTRGNDAATIKIGSHPGRAEELVIYIQDNGLDSDRDSAAEPHEGALGLANVHKIIARHGGRVWSETTVHDGTTFFFSLPNENHPAAAATNGSAPYNIPMYGN
jgi:CheY-like chemotaxis protein